MSTPPAGTVTFLMTDIESSSRMWEAHGDDFLPMLETHNRLVRDILGRHNGYEVQTQGDSFFYVFDTANEALAGAVEVQIALRRLNLGIRIRIGIHTGEPAIRGDDYLGPPVNRCGRIRDAAHGGQILLSASTAALVRDHLPPGVSLLDRGEHRLRDLGMPERLFQVSHLQLIREFPPLRTLEAQPNNLPAQRSSFIGRERELGILHELIAPGKARLITLTGPGGCGKTRLALQVAADHLIDFPDGVWYVPLSAISDPAQLLPEIATAILGKTAITPGPAQMVADELGSKQALIVLDSFEHLLPAVRDLGDLLSRLPRVTCLVTSRALLYLSGEHEFQVPPMSDTESVLLFLERAQAARPDFAPDNQEMRAVVNICQQLNGLPLAIELAAARVRGMTVSQIAQRLERRFDLLSGGRSDMPDRQRTMRAALDWSYDLLTEEEQSLFAQLSVFVGGFSLEAAEEVCEGENVLEGVFSLRDRSLLSTENHLGETRYAMLSLVREYALEKVTNLSALRVRHAACYLRVAQEWGPKMSGAEQRHAIARLDLEHGNLDAAMRWADETRHWQLVAELVNALGTYAHTRGRITPSVYEIVCRAVEGLQHTDDIASLAALLLALGGMAWMQRRFEEGETCVNQSLAFYRTNNLHARACSAISILGLIATDQGRFDLARQRFREGLQLAEEADCLPERAILLQNLSMMELRAGNDDEAGTLAQECLTLNRALGDEDSCSYQIHTLSLIAWKRGHVVTGRRLMAESLQIREAIGDLPGLARTFWDLGRIVLEIGDLDGAAVLLLAARRLESSCLLPTEQEDNSTYERLYSRIEPERLAQITARVAEMPLPEIIARARAMLEVPDA